MFDKSPAMLYLADTTNPSRMNPFSANYTPNQANAEYQASLKAQQQGDGEAFRSESARFESYDLKARVPDWKRLLDIEKPQAWSTRSLLEAVAVLQNPKLVPTGPRQTEQLASFHAALQTRF